MDYALAQVDFARDELPDLEAQLAALIEAGQRVVPVRYLAGTAWLILRHEDVARAFRDPQQFPAAAANLRYSLPVQGRTLLCMEGEEHRIHRALVAGAFQPQAVQEYVGRLLVPLANELIDAFGARRELDLVAEYCHRYPLRVIARLLGIPAANEEQLFAWVRGLFDYPFHPEAALRACAEVNAFLLPLIQARRAVPRADLISRLAAAEVEGHRLSDEDILGFVKLLFPAGADTTYLTLGSMMNAVLGDAALQARLRADASLIAPAVEETVRLFGGGPVATLHRDRRAHRRGADSAALLGALRRALRGTRRGAVPAAAALRAHAPRAAPGELWRHAALLSRRAPGARGADDVPGASAAAPARAAARARAGAGKLGGAARRAPPAGRLR